MQESAIKYSSDTAKKRGNQIQYLLRRSMRGKTNEVLRNKNHVAGWNSGPCDYWGSETLSNCNPYDLSGAISSSGAPESAALWAGCPWIKVAAASHRGSDVETLCRRTSQLSLALGEWKIPPPKHTHIRTRTPSRRFGEVVLSSQPSLKDSVTSVLSLNSCSAPSGPDTHCSRWNSAFTLKSNPKSN